jgi:hypothetical protein
MVRVGFFGEAINFPFDIPEDAIALLYQVDRDLSAKAKAISVAVMGSTVLVLDENAMDVMEVLANTPARESFRKAGVNLIAPSNFHFHPKFKERLINIDADLKYVHASYVSPEDIFLVKLNSSRKQDRDDVRTMIDNRTVNIKLLNTLFKEWNDYWHNGDPLPEVIYRNVKRSCGVKL